MLYNAAPWLVTFLPRTGGGLAVAGLVRAAVGPAADPRQQVNSGMAKFRKNEIEAAVADFDAAWQAAPQLRPFLWQRGLALYYIGRYKDAAQQFRRCVQAALGFLGFMEGRSTNKSWMR